MKKASRSTRRSTTSRRPRSRSSGHVARRGPAASRSWTTGALPIVEDFLQRMKLEAAARRVPPWRRSPHQDPHRPRGGDPRQADPALPHAAVCRGRVDRGTRSGRPRTEAGTSGRLERRPRRPGPDGPLPRRPAVARAGPHGHIVRQFDLHLDELHNDSTTVSSAACTPAQPRGRPSRQADGGHHLGPQQGPSPRPQATAVYPHRHPRRRGPGGLPRGQRQRDRRPHPRRELGLALPVGRPGATSSTWPTASWPR